MSIASLSWPEVLGCLAARRDLSPEQAGWALGQIVAGSADDARIAAFAMGLRAKGETTAEVGALVSALLEHAVTIDAPGCVLDVVGTGGDLAHSVNVSTMAALVAAAAGAPVLKHGNRAASSTTGTADVLEELGVVLALEPADVLRCLATAGIGFCFAPAYHPSLRHAAPARRALGIPTVFNILGPLANPGRAGAALIGCADERLAPVMAEVLAGRGCRALVVRGEDGLDEITPYAATRVWDVTGEALREDVIDATALGIPVPAPDALRGGDAAANARVVREVMGGDRRGRLSAVRDVVRLNAAAALVAYDAATGELGLPDATASAQVRVAEALPIATEALDSGRALITLEAWIAASAA